MLRVQIRLDSVTHTHTHTLQCSAGIYCCGFVEAIYWQYLSPAWPGAFSTISTGTVPLEDYQHSSSFSPGKRPLVKFMRGFISSVHNNFILILICSDILGSTDGCFPTRNEFIWVLWPAVKPASNRTEQVFGTNEAACTWAEVTTRHSNMRLNLLVRIFKSLLRIQEHGIALTDACLLCLLLQKWNHQHPCASIKFYLA